MFLMAKIVSVMLFVKSCSSLECESDLYRSGVTHR